MEKIQRLSHARRSEFTDASGLLFVGSFAPVHDGHFDAVRSAERAMLTRGERISAVVFAPNSDSYVLEKKIGDSNGFWNFNQRVNMFLTQRSGTLAPSYVDDVSGMRPPERTISEAAIASASSHLGIKACNFILVVGTDQIASMKPHLETNRAICILRPGYESVIEDYASQEWFMSAVESGRYILAERENIEKDVSSTSIRELHTKALGAAIHD